MKRLAVIGASYLQLPLVKKAKEMNLEVHCFAWDKGAICKSEADFFYPISIIDKDQILDICQRIKIDGICSIASDVAAPTVAYIAQKMGLNSNTYYSAILANNKFLMRQALSKYRVPCPNYLNIDSAQDINSIEWRFPIIVKPTDRSGSLGVNLVYNKKDLFKAAQIAIEASFEKKAIAEEYIDGREISVEFISFQGKHYPLTITDKVTTGAPHFVELEHHQPANLPEELYKTIYSLNDKALSSLGITNGASHAEYKITSSGDIFVIEIGGRMGGDFIGSNLVKLSTGYDFLRGVIEIALGTFHKPILASIFHAGVYFLSKETEWLRTIIENKENYPEVKEAEITDSKLRTIECSRDRSGYLIYQSDRKVNYV